MSTNTYRTNDINEHKSKEASVSSLGAQSENGIHLHWRAPAVLLGILVGNFVQLATVGINTLVLVAIGTDVLVQRNDISVGLPIIYNAVTLISIWATLAILRTLLKSANHLGRQSNEESVSGEDTKLKVTLAQFEGNFILGAAFGAGTLWLVADLLMGTSSKMYFALMPLNIILIVYVLLVAGLSTRYR